MKRYLSPTIVILLLAITVSFGALTTFPYTFGFTEQQKREWDAILTLFVQKTGDVMTGDLGLTGGNVIVSTIGKGVQVKEGTNARMGTATLVGGTVTVANTSITASSRIFLSRSTTGGTAGNLSTTQTANTSFVITSSSGTDTSVINWMLIEPAP